MRRLAEAAPPPLFPGVPSMLRALAAGGIRLAVVTSNGERTVRRALGPEAALIERFACGTALFGKAARLTRLARALGIDPRRALAIGDERRDGEAARAAGLAFGAVGWGTTRPGALDDLAAVTFARVEDVVRYLLPDPP